MTLSKTILTAATLSLASLTGCATHTMSMNYAPSSAAEPTVRVDSTETTRVVLGNVTDRRSSDANWLGKVQGDHGFTEARIYTDTSTTDVLSTAFESALEHKGLLAASDSADYRLDVELLEFDSHQRWGKKTRTDIAVTVVESQSGKNVLQRNFRTQYETGHANSARTDELAALGEFANLALNESVDQVLQDPALLALLKNKPAQGVQLVSAGLAR